jgi:F-type H+-transporting ATPase subunit a
MAQANHAKSEVTAEADSHGGELHAGLVPSSESPAVEHGHGEGHDPLAAETLIAHVRDTDYFHVPRLFSPATDGHIYIPQFPDSVRPQIQIKTGMPQLDELIEPLDFKITKFMVLELIAAVLLVAVIVPAARRIRLGDAPRGRLRNLLEVMVIFIRDQVARPTIGSHDGDRFTPFLLTLFFFVLTCNLLGMVPWAGSPTGSLATTGSLAVITFGVVILAGSLKLGPIRFWLDLVPSIDVPLLVRIPLWLMMFVIEVLGLVIKHFVLAMRLLANMMAGHMVLAVLVGFIGASAGSLAFIGVLPASILGSLALSLLELFVAFLQAYIFAFLAGLFIGMAVHPH